MSCSTIDYNKKRTTDTSLVNLSSNTLQNIQCCPGWLQIIWLASERAFSSGGRTSTKLQNRLLPENFEAVHILKEGYHTGMIDAVQQAALHTDLLCPELTDIEEKNGMTALSDYQTSDYM